MEIFVDREEDCAELENDNSWCEPLYHSISVKATWKVGSQALKTWHESMSLLK